jgi:phosphoserine aminotransferase
MPRVFNFSAGPAALPEPVLRQAAEEMLDWQGSGLSVMEMSHRGPHFMAIHADAIERFARLVALPAGYRVLFLQGGALGENAFVPMNLCGGPAAARPGGAVIDMVETGQWSRKSAAEARRYAQVNIAASTTGSPRGATFIPDPAGWRHTEGAAYLHCCANETIDGVQFHAVPAAPAGTPLVADVSSEWLSRPIDLARFGLVYGGAQKNIGPAGLTIVVVQEALLGRALPCTPSAFDYAVVAANDSMFNTPPTWAIYVAGLVFRWIEQQGGLPAMERANRAKSAALYAFIDASALYENRVDPAARSWMNVPFFLRRPGLDTAFLDGAAERGLVQLKGHRAVGGLRASLYNAMPMEGVLALIDWMATFERRHA